MSKEITNVKELIAALESSVGYFIGVTLFNGDGLQHYFLTENFPQNDLLRSLAVIKKLVVEELEKPFVQKKSNDLKPEDIIDAPTTPNS